MSKEKKDNHHCDMNVRKEFIKKHPKFGVGRVCNTQVFPPDFICPNTARHA